MTGRVVTFYSYKGGVGRTFALANVAVLLARWGWKTLVIDFDLEAPGLHAYFGDLLLSKRGPGLVDLVVGHARGEPGDWRTTVQRADLGTDGGHLDVLRAGRVDDPVGYRDDLAKLNWPALYGKEHDLGRAFERWRTEWVDTYDFVLIDSRTGLTDTQGISTAQLPDVLVVLFTCNDQSIEGVLEVAKQSRKDRARLPIDRLDLHNLPIIPVVTRHAREMREEWAKWRSIVASRVAPFIDAWPEPRLQPEVVVDLVGLPHRDALTFGEGLPVRQSMDKSGIVDDLTTLAALVATGLDGSDRLKNDRAAFLRAAEKGVARPGERRRVWFSGDRLLPELASALAVRGVDLVGPQVVRLGENWATALETAFSMTEAAIFAVDAPLSRWEMRELEDAEARADYPIVMIALREDVPVSGSRAHRRLLVGPALADQVVAALFGDPTPANPLAAYSFWLRARHSHLIPFFPDADKALLADVYVALDVNLEGGGPDRGPERMGAYSIEDYIRAHRCSAVLGEPGAGKTTMLRHLTWRLAGATDGAIPVFIPLSRETGQVLDPFATAEAESGISGLAVALTSPTRPIWVLLDGLDEVAPERIEVVREQVVVFARKHPAVNLLITSRHVAIEAGGLPAGFVTARIQPLDAPRRRLLVERLLDADRARPLVEEIERRPALAELARNPLLLTLLAVVAREAGSVGAGLPSRRTRLYERAVDLLLRRGFAVHPTGVADPKTARRVLRQLSLGLQRGEGEDWAEAEILERLRLILRSDAELSTLVSDTWKGPVDLLRDLGLNSGVLGPHDGTGTRWRYLHGSLREFLAAERLVEQGEAGIDAFVAEWAKAVVRAGAHRVASRWGEVHALLCGLVPEPVGLLERLWLANREMGVRGLVSADIAPDVALDFLFARDWREDDLLGLLTNHGSALAPALDAYVTPQASVRLLAIIWWALEGLGRRPSREAFFQFAGKTLGTAPAAVWIPAGSFYMGSPAGVGLPPEHPRHRVTLTRAFGMGRTTVTKSEWASFDGAEQVGSKGELPTTGVSWYEARLYAIWVGGRLPTEAEWEYACRAGTQTGWSFGDDGGELLKHGWFAGTSVHPVGGKVPNPWGLHDMHGNVFEWCEDELLRSYTAAAVVDPILPPSFAPRGKRVIRGGAWNGSVAWCRSAYRFMDHADALNDWLGFRVVLPAPGEG